MLKSNENRKEFIRKIRTLTAGISGGVISTLTLHPLDLIKVRLQADYKNITLERSINRRVYRGVNDAVNSIVKDRGVLGLFQGATPNIIGSGASWGLYFFFYNTVKRWLQNGDETLQLSPYQHLLSGMLSGSTTLCITNPIWVVKTRICLQQQGQVTKQPIPLKNNASLVNSIIVPKRLNSNVYKTVLTKNLSSYTTQHYTGVIDTLVKIYRYEGIRGLYRGLIPGLFGVSHGAIQFMSYDELKIWYNVQCKNRPINHKLLATEYVIFAAISKAIAVVTTYPYQVVRTRLQDKDSGYGKKVLTVIRNTYTIDGLLGFYRGMGANLFRVVPACAITFLIYEKIMSATSSF